MNTENKIILFYKYIDLSDPWGIQKWQQKICSDLNLKGRIILACEGINGTLAGTPDSIARYRYLMDKHPLLNNIDYKEREGHNHCFPRLRIVVKNEIVRLELDEHKASSKNTGVHLTSSQAHKLITKNPNDLMILDARNRYESAIGRFKNAVTPDVNHFRELPAYIDAHLEDFKNKQVLMYCTGGIRCERASAYLKSKGIAKEVYQLKGGIHRYVEQFPDGFFRGKNYVFDGRIAVQVTDEILSTCAVCSIPCDDYTNCLLASCNKHFICCTICLKNLQGTCSNKCYELVYTHCAPKRPLLHKVSNDKIKVP